MLVGVFLAILAFVFVIVLLSGNPAPDGTGAQPTAATELDTVVAARDIPLGVTVTAAMVTTQKILVADREIGALGNTTQAIGKVARQTILKGQQITTLQFLEQAADNIECPAGFTCMAVQVDQVSGVGTLIRTGDYVNVLANVSPAFPIVDSETITVIPPELYDPVSVKVLLQGLQVVATLLPPPPTTETGVATAEPGSSGPGTALTGQQEIVILAVTAQQSEVIKFVQLDGTITLTLRSPKDFVDEQGNQIIPEVDITTGTILQTLVTDFGVLPPELIVTVLPTAAP
jgi:Flp pilus assembly protein CpaB